MSLMHLPYNTSILPCLWPPSIPATEISKIDNRELEVLSAKVCQVCL